MAAGLPELLESSDAEAVETLLMKTNRDIKGCLWAHSCRGFSGLCFKGWHGWWEEMVLSDQNQGLKVTANASLEDEKKIIIIKRAEGLTGLISLCLCSGSNDA